MASWQGEGIKSTETFTVGREWKIRWLTEPGQIGDSNFAITVYDANGNYSALAANVIGANRDESIYHQAGTYYLEIMSGQPYIIEVWDKR